VRGRRGGGCFGFLRFSVQMLSRSILLGIKVLTSRWDDDRGCANL